MKNIILAFTLLFGLAGCSTLETLGDYINDNQLLTDIAARQVTGRYIAAGNTLEEEKARALQVETRLERVLRYVDGNPAATISGLMTLVESSIEWNQLDVADRLLVDDILALLRKELSQYDDAQGMSKPAQIAIRGLFETAISAARVYLMRG